MIETRAHTAFFMLGRAFGSVTGVADATHHTGRPAA